VGLKGSGVDSAIDSRPLDAGIVLCPLPAGGRLPRPQATAGLGGVPGLDQEPDSADHAGAVPDPDLVAAVAVPPGGARRRSVVAASTVEPAQDPAQCVGPGALPPPAS